MSIEFKSGITFFANIKPKRVVVAKNFSDLRQDPVIQAEEKSLINKDSIRPKHIEDETISYKSSGYVKDLLGEEH